MVARSVCDTPPCDRLCSVAPKDNTDFDASFIYLNLEKNAQNPFDIFSWQTFVALNRPANDAGVPVGEPIGTRPDLPRVWQSYRQPGEVFGPASEDRPCPSGGDAALFKTGMIFQSSGLPLIDRDYRLISTQWRGSPGSKLFPNGEVPRFLTDVTLETYDQYTHGGTCIGCHAKAVTLAGEDANFSFLPAKAR